MQNINGIFNLHSCDFFVSNWPNDMMYDGSLGWYCSAELGGCVE